MKRKNIDISSNFRKFEQLVVDRKNTTQKVITLDTQKQNRNDINYFESKVKHITLADEISLIIEAKVRNHSDFKFKLRCKSLTEEPYFRFDSDGVAHQNKDPEIPLREQMVTTPHFNSFDKNGRSIAYKTDKLKDEREAKALEDINLCFAHFCFETNLRYLIEDITEIVPTPSTELFFASTSNEDILSNITFIK